MTRAGDYNLQVTSAQRFASGVIATLVRGSERVTLHFTGAGTDATRAVADYCDRHGYRVSVLSTPSTVYRDLQGARGATSRMAVSSWFYAPPPENRLDLPERAMLGKIGRIDLLVQETGSR